MSSGPGFSPDEFSVALQFQHSRGAVAIMGALVEDERMKTASKQIPGHNLAVVQFSSAAETLHHGFSQCEIVAIVHAPPPTPKSAKV